jgi:hypothetical protein
MFSAPSHLHKSKGISEVIYVFIQTSKARSSKSLNEMGHNSVDQLSKEIIAEQVNQETQ